MRTASCLLSTDISKSIRSCKGVHSTAGGDLGQGESGCSPVTVKIAARGLLNCTASDLDRFAKAVVFCSARYVEGSACVESSSSASGLLVNLLFSVNSSLSQLKNKNNFHFKLEH